MFSGVGSHNPNKDVEVSQPPEDSISKIAFSPNSNHLIGSSWNNTVRCWEIHDNGTSVAKAEQQHSGPVLDCCWVADGTKVLTASCDKTCKLWDLQSNQAVSIGTHDAPIRCVRWIEAPNYKCAVTGSWDKTVKFWDARQPTPVLALALPERCYCMDIMYPLGVVGTAGRGVVIYSLENQPHEYRQMESPLKYQHRCVSIFKDKNSRPAGFALGSIEGRVAIHYINPTNPSKDNFTFKCHRSVVTAAGQTQNIYAVNDISFHPTYGTLATVGSDGRYYFWDKDARTKLKNSDPMEQPITACTFNSNGFIFAYSVSYDWSKGHEFYNPSKKNAIFLHQANEDLKPRKKTR